MIETIASRLTSYMITHGIIAKDDADIYLFGWIMLLQPIISFGVIFLIGACFGQLVGTAIYLIFFSVLRTYAGGWHADSSLKCFLITIALYSGCLLLHRCLPVSAWGWVILALTLLSIGIIFIWAPVDHPNKPFRDGQKQKNKRASRITIMVQSLLVLALMVWQPWLNPYLLWAAMGMAATSFTLFYLICRPYKTVR